MNGEFDFGLTADTDDASAVEYIKKYLPQELKEKFTDDELFYFLDLIDEYYAESGILEAEPDEEGYVNVDLEEIVAFIMKESEKDGIGKYEPEDIFFVVQGEMEFEELLLQQK